MATGPALPLITPSLIALSMHLLFVDASVLAIFGLVHQVAARADTPLSSDDTICQGGTLTFDGLAISTTGLLLILIDSGSCMIGNLSLLDGGLPSAITASRTSG